MNYPSGISELYFQVANELMNASQIGLVFVHSTLPDFWSKEFLSATSFISIRLWKDIVQTLIERKWQQGIVSCSFETQLTV